MNTVVFPVLVPLLAGLVCAIVPTRTPKRALAVIACVLQMVIAAGLLAATANGTRLGLLLGGWKAPLGIVLVVDLLAAIMLGLSALMLFVATLYGFGEKGNHSEHPLRLALLQFLCVGVNLSFLTGDLFNLFVAFEVMLLSSYALLTLEAKGTDARFGFDYFVMNVVGSTLFLCLAGLAYGLWGTLNFADLSVKMAAETVRSRVVVFSVLSVLVFGMKAGVFPLYYWLPRSYPTLPPPVAAFFAGMLTKVGIYVLLRLFCTVFPPGLQEATSLVGWLSVGTMIFGVLGALSRNTIRGVLSYHVISQVGYMTLCVGILSPAAVTACIVYIAHHIIVKASLFLIGGVAARIQGTDELTLMGGVARSHPLLAGLFLLQSFSLAGLPPLSGFWGKYLILVEALQQERPWFVAAALVAGILTLMSMLKIWLATFWGAPRTPSTSHLSTPSKARAVFVGTLSAAVLTAVSLFVGFGFPVVYAFAETASQVALDASGYASFVAGLQSK
jgi:multicomponent Na+:H+ antiporter subunit D